MNIALMRNAYMATTMPTCSACSRRCTSSFLLAFSFLLANAVVVVVEDSFACTSTPVSLAAPACFFVRNAGNTNDVKYIPRGTKKYPMTRYQQ